MGDDLLSDIKNSLEASENLLRHANEDLVQLLLQTDVIPRPPLLAIVDVSIDPSYDRPADIVVSAGDDLQAALDAVQPGQIVELGAGATFIGNFKLRKKAGDEWIYIRSSRYKDLLCVDRVGPEHANLMPKLVGFHINVPALEADFGAHHYRMVGIEFTSNKDDNQIVRLGTEIRSWVHTGASTLEQLPHHITFDRVYVHGHPEHSVRIGLQIDAADSALINSCVCDIHHHGQDSQAVGATNAAGPILIQNNLLEGAGENIMFGGGDPKIPGLVQSDIAILNNTISKPLSWKNPILNGPHTGSKWSVKNLLELKHARRVLIEGNIMEHNWPHAQSGTAIQLTPRNQNHTAPQSTVEDVLFRYNIVRDSKNLVNILSSDTQHGPSQTASRIIFEHNLVYDIDHMMVELSTGTGKPPSQDIVFSHNTMLHRGTGNTFLVISQERPSSDGLVFVDNIVTHGQYGIHFSSGTIDEWLVNYDISNNVVIGGTRNVPGGNILVGGVAGVGFVDVAAGDYRLNESSPYENAATDGSDIGADVARLPN